MTAATLPSLRRRGAARSRRVAVRGRVGVGLALVVLTLAVAVFGPLFAPHTATQFVGAGLEAPSAHAWLGTDALGRDVLSRVLLGGWSVVWMSVLSATLGAFGGAALGAFAALAPARLGFVIMRLCDVLLALPALVFALVFVSLLGSSPALLIVLVAAGHLPQSARIAYSSAREVNEREYVQWAKAVGMPWGRTLVHDVLPGISGPVLVDYGLRVVWSVGIVATLGVLGVGIQPPAADWGLMINDNRIGMAAQPLSVLVPLALIAAFAIGVNLVTDGLARRIARVRDDA